MNGDDNFIVINSENICNVEEYDRLWTRPRVSFNNNNNNSNNNNNNNNNNNDNNDNNLQIDWHNNANIHADSARTPAFTLSGGPPTTSQSGRFVGW